MAKMCRMTSTANTIAMVPLGDLAFISAGHPLRDAVDKLPSGAVTIVQIRDVDADSGVDWVGAAHICPPGKRSPDYLEPGDVIFTTRGVRNLAVAIENVPGPSICAPNLFVLRIKKSGMLLPEYLAWYMNQRPAQAYFQRSATGTNILNIRREVVEQIQIPLPSMARQHAIAGFERAARAERQVLRNLIKNRDQQMEALALALAGCQEA